MKLTVNNIKEVLMLHEYHKLTNIEECYGVIVWISDGEKTELKSYKEAPKTCLKWIIDNSVEGKSESISDYKYLKFRNVRFKL